MKLREGLRSLPAASQCATSSVFSASSQPSFFIRDADAALAYTLEDQTEDERLIEAIAWRQTWSR